MMTDRLSYSLEEAAQITGMTVEALRDLAEAEILGFQPKVKGKPCGERLFPRLQLVTWLEANGGTNVPHHRPDLMSIKEVARRLSLSTSTVNKLIQHHKLSAVKLGRAIRVKTVSVEKYMGEKLR
ncbi:MAG: helix-turn-helix domain-containing protein [Propionibacteriaceae bacterium]|jgi:excisionase family DNA binding protein|nr:helix-turn-helix domain-containing protein [Propionibacteriaceae bacterium]